MYFIMSKDYYTLESDNDWAQILTFYHYQPEISIEGKNIPNGLWECFLVPYAKWYVMAFSFLILFLSEVAEIGYPTHKL